MELVTNIQVCSQGKQGSAFAASWYKYAYGSTRTIQSIQSIQYNTIQYNTDTIRIQYEESQAQILYNLHCEGITITYQLFVPLPSASCDVENRSPDIWVRAWAGNNKLIFGETDILLDGITTFVNKSKRHEIRTELSSSKRSRAGKKEADKGKKIFNIVCRGGRFDQLQISLPSNLKLIKRISYYRSPKEERKKKRVGQTISYKGRRPGYFMPKSHELHLNQHSPKSHLILLQSFCGVPA